jgi:hypothetical protein
MERETRKKEREDRCLMARKILLCPQPIVYKEEKAIATITATMAREQYLCHNHYHQNTVLGFIQVCSC